MSSFSPVKGQRGVVLVVALVMLTMVTLIAVSSFNLSKTDLQIAQNMEIRAVTRSYAQFALDELVSVGDFWKRDRFTKSYDTNGDTREDVLVSVAKPQCISVKENRVATPYCVNGLGSDPVCWDIVWGLTATSEDGDAGAASVVRQGVSVLHMDTSWEVSCFGGGE